MNRFQKFSQEALWLQVLIPLTSWLTRFGSWLCSDCSKSNGASTMSNGAHLPTPELSSLSRSVSRSSSRPASKYPRCVTCKKTLLGGSTGSIHCKSCSTKNRDEQALQARLAEVEAEKIRTQIGQVRKIGKPLFWKKIRAKIRTEKVHRSFPVPHDHMPPISPLDFCGLSGSGEKSQAALPSRKRKHGKSLVTFSTVD